MTDRDLCAERLKEARRLSGLTLRQVYEATGLSDTSLCRWENGRGNITVANLEILAKFYKRHIRWFFGCPGPEDVEAIRDVLSTSRVTWAKLRLTDLAEVLRTGVGHG